MTKVLIKKTDQILDVSSQYSVLQISVSLNFEVRKDIKEQTYVHKSASEKEGNWFILSDGKKYHEDQLIVGEDQIRDYKLNKII